jgi:4-diphosphocytidyl-2-C-methyl-D-erythritol kinase
MIDALNKHSLDGVARRMYNVFEDVLPKGTSAIGEIKEKMYDHAALGTAMTGTGSAVFGIFGDISSAKSAYEDLKGKYQECFLTGTQQRIEI